MIVIPTNPLAHYLFDGLAWIGGTTAAVWQHRQWPDEASRLSAITGPTYFVSLAVGGVIGAWLLGSANSLRSAIFVPSHSIAGALAGAIVAVELWKRLHGVRQSTGGTFVLPICAGIVIGRFGCFFAGLPDYTFGNPTNVPWAVDLGDGVGRHPVQLYEALAMAVFLVVYLRARLTNLPCARHHAFQAMIIYYASQRFLWEFLKPYPAVLGPLNLFHFLMLGLIAYGIIWWRRSRFGELSPARTAPAEEVRAISLPQPDDQPLREVPRTRSGQDHH